MYACNIFGDRIGVLHSSRLTDEEYTPPDYWAAVNSSRFARTYDYVDGQLLVERESSLHGSPPPERFVSVYTWGPLGLIARRGVSVRNGYWDPNGGEYCDPEHPEQGVTGEFVSVDPNVMQDYTYMADHIGNIVALVDGNPDSPTFGTARRQVFDAFGNSVGGYIMFQCASDHDWTDDPWHLGHFADPPELPCPNNPAQSVERMQTGSFNWRGAEGSITDRVAEDMPDTEENVLRWSAYTRPSTGLIYMVNRYYEPETGRFTQADPMPYEYTQFTVGQNNRWSYCANDPANCRDPRGLAPVLFAAGALGLAAGLLFAVGFAVGLFYGKGSPTNLLQLFLVVMAGVAGELLCTIGGSALASVLLPALGPILIMGGFLAACFFAGYSLGKFVGDLLALVPKRQGDPVPDGSQLGEEPAGLHYAGASACEGNTAVTITMHKSDDQWRALLIGGSSVAKEMNDATTTS